MTVIACTKALFEHSGFPQAPVPEVGYNPLYSWHAHLFRAGKKNCVLLMNDLTRYQLMFYGVKKEHYRNFNGLFLHYLAENLRADQFPESAISTFLSNSGGATIFTKTHNRSILGSINDHAYIVAHWIEQYLPSNEIHLIGLNRKLNDAPMLKLREFNAARELKKALQVT